MLSNNKMSYDDNFIILDDLSKSDLWTLLRENVKEHLPKGQRNKQRVSKVLKSMNIKWTNTHSDLVDAYDTVRNKDRVTNAVKQLPKVIPMIRNPEKHFTLSRDETAINNVKKHFDMTRDTTFRNNVVIKAFTLTNEKYRYLLIKKNINSIINIVKNYIVQAIKQEKRKFGHDNLTYQIQMNFQSSNGSYYRNFVLRNTNVYEDQFHIEMMKMISTLPAQAQENIDNNAKDAPDYLYKFIGFRMIIINGGKSGGCDSSEHAESLIDKRNPDQKFHLLSLKSKRNNCLLNCFNRALNIKKVYPHTIKKALGYGPDDPIDYKHLPKIAKYYQTTFNIDCGYKLMNHDQDVIMEYNVQSENLVFIFLLPKDEHFHYYLCDKIICAQKKKVS